MVLTSDHNHSEGEMHVLPIPEGENRSPLPDSVASVQRLTDKVNLPTFASLGSDDAPRTVQGRWTRIRIRFGGENFDFNPWAAEVGGFCISLVCSLFGVGGGFRVTPFLASVLLFPMYLVMRTSLIALMCFR
jgi:hypothetical protein